MEDINRRDLYFAINEALLLHSDEIKNMDRDFLSNLLNSIAFGGNLSEVQLLRCTKIMKKLEAF